MLAFYDPNKEVQLVTDASNHALGAVLLQHDDDNLRPISYISRSLTPAEQYSITEKEALSLVWAIEKLHLYLYGKTFKAVVDHKPLKYILSTEGKLNAHA